MAQVDAVGYLSALLKCKVGKGTNPSTGTLSQPEKNASKWLRDVSHCPSENTYNNQQQHAKLNWSTLHTLAFVQKI